MCVNRSLLVAPIFTVVTLEFLMALQLKIRKTVHGLHVLLQRDVEAKQFVAECAGDQLDRPDDSGDGAVEDGDKLEVVLGPQMLAQSLLTKMTKYYP